MRKIHPAAKGLLFGGTIGGIFILLSALNVIDIFSGIFALLTSPPLVTSMKLIEKYPWLQENFTSVSTGIILILYFSLVGLLFVLYRRKTLGIVLALFFILIHIISVVYLNKTLYTLSENLFSR